VGRFDNGTFQLDTIHIWGLWRNFATCKIHFASKSCVLLYWQRYSTALQQRGQPNFAAWYKEWNYGTFAQCATIFGWAAITLGISPHSSLFPVCQKLIGYQKMSKLQWISIVTAWRHASAVYICLSVCLSVTSRCSILKRLNVGSRKQRHTTSPRTLVFWCWRYRYNSNGVTPPPNGGVKCSWDRFKMVTFDK